MNKKIALALVIAFSIDQITGVPAWLMAGFSACWLWWEMGEPTKPTINTVIPPTGLDDISQARLRKQRGDWRYPA